MRYLIIVLAILLIFYACFDVGYKAIKKNHLKREPEIVFYKSGQPVWKTRGTHEDAEWTMKCNPQFDFYEFED